ncbi:MAG: MotA/TolQ/ExbB proton channel family protein [Syntrophobacterales bacterium]|nr:MotA/TolQ/ExbB proton channel family protein [Syntrophobacterales bacterium]
MNMTNFLMNFAIIGGNWVLLLLLILSCISIAFIIERYIIFYRWGKETEKLWKTFNRCLCNRRLEDIQKSLYNFQTPLINLINVAIETLPSGYQKIEGALEAEKIFIRLTLNKRLSFLGTLGSNAPFIGLFGTVIGIVHAFRVLGTTGHGGAQIMSAIAEALIATALGLFVAIPCTISYNYFKKKEVHLMAYADAMTRLILKEVQQ